jgi:hypothetical protein
MKNLIVLFYCLFIALMLSGCEVVGDIFGAGVYTGMFIVIFVIIVIIVIVAKIFRR